jgi:HD-like signal output (HDOD) protein
MTDATADTDSPPSAEPLEAQAERIARELVIPPCPAILGRFAAEMNKDEPDLRKLAGFIGNDVALSAAMLSAVNSPYYGLGRKASNVQHALSILGLRAGANLITRLLMRKAFPASSSALMRRFWDDSAHLAATAADICAYIKAVDRDEAHTYALFRDCGMAVMIARFADYGELLEARAHSPGMGLIAGEDAKYRYNHARVGYSLARGWLLPEALCKSILYHHDIARVSTGHIDIAPIDTRLVAFGLLAEQVVALRAGRGLCPDWLPGESFVLQTLKLDPDQIVAMGERDALVPA